MEKEVVIIEKWQANEILVRLSTIEKAISDLKAQANPNRKSNVSEYITRADVSRMLKVSIVTVSDWTRKGILTAYKCGNRVYFKQAEVEEALLRINSKKERNKMEKEVVIIEKWQANEILVRLSTIEKAISDLKAQANPNRKSNVSEYITRADVSRMLKVSIVTVSDWTRKGILTAYKCGNRVYFKQAEVEEALLRINSIKK
ncbi:helix-turn-helix domain-containing protein [uncultured Bacteroides sp.]|uniref:helix-turn-helix domain-containing protein n=1 Tax=uncultured Bacteroides sp. TaxID=162156 RepID=UPI002606A811|nr:helix-turn-helix domain-containing protein [uncultured Bacteroides sp.]